MRKILIKIKLIGALTSKPYSFRSRPWELKVLNSIDLYDTLGSNIKINYKGSSILRITPGINEYINEEWISDKIRFSYDSINRWRYTVPLVKKQDKYQQFSWKHVLKEIEINLTANKIKQYKIYNGNYSSLETLAVAKDVFNKIGNNEFKTNINIQNNDNFFFNNFSTLDINSIKGNKVFILCGTNLRLENPILNLKFRKLSKKKNILLISVGTSYENTCYMYHVGNNMDNVFKIIQGKHYICKIISKFVSKNYTVYRNYQKEINVILGNNITSRFDINHLISIVKNFSKKNKLILLTSAVGDLNANLINFKNNYLTANTSNKLHYFLNTELKAFKCKPKDLLLFQGHHNFFFQNKVDIILPSTTFFETQNLYVNCLNILQETNKIDSFFKEVREDWKILLIISKKIFKNSLNYLNRNEVVSRVKNLSGIKYFDKVITKNNYICYMKTKQKNFLYKTTIKNSIFNYYLTDSLTKASKNMQNCSNVFFKNKHSYLWK